MNFNKKLNKRGFPLLPVVVLAVAIFAGTYLVQQKTQILSYGYVAGSARTSGGSISTHKTPTPKPTPVPSVVTGECVYISCEAPPPGCIDKHPIYSSCDPNIKVTCGTRVCTDPYNLNGDGKVNYGDVLYLISKWGTSNAKADLNHDGVVNGKDLTLLQARLK